jgi:nitroreductase
MDVFEAITTRRSIRKYLQVPVEWDKITELIRYAKSAPSAGNLQNWQFLIVINKNNRRALAQAAGEQYWMEQAPCHIVVCSTPKSKPYYGIRGERLYDIQNCAAAVQNIMLAATAMNLGTCWIGAFDEDSVKDITGVPGNARVQAIITVGYPDEQPPRPAQYPLHHVAYVERYGVHYDVDMAGKEHAAHRQAKLKMVGEAIKDKVKQIHNKVKKRSEDEKQKKELEKTNKEHEELTGKTK